MPPSFSFALDRPISGLSILVFMVMGALFTVLFERLRRSQARSDTRFEATFEQAAMGIALVALAMLTRDSSAEDARAPDIAEIAAARRLLARLRRACAKARRASAGCSTARPSP